jgi:hypothetical protein
VSRSTSSSTVAAPAAAEVSHPTDPASGFFRLWAVAALAHIIGNRPREPYFEQLTLVRVSLIALGAAALWLLVVPANRRARVAVAALVVATWWLEAPVTGNHWLLAALVSAGLLVATLRRAPWVTTAALCRFALVGFYSFAAFAKLNAGFLDSAASCGIFYPNQMLGAVGLPSVATGSAVAPALPWATAAVELAVPLLLLVPRTRRAGVLLGVVFHSLITLDFDQHFYDFTAVLVPLFLCFLDGRVLARVGSWRPTERATASTVGLGGALVWLAVTPQSTGTEGLVRIIAFVIWIPAVAAVVRAVAATGDEGVARLGRPAPSALAVVSLIVLNGLAPYLGVKTATSWNMYANLEVAGGESNHYLVPWLGEWREVEYVTVLASDDEDLARYVGSGYEVPLVNLAAFLDRHPAAGVTVRRADATVQELDAASTAAPNVFVRKLLASRSADTVDPPRCQAEFLPAL